MKQPLSVRVLIIPVVTALAAIALIALALMPAPNTPGAPTKPKALENQSHEPPPLNPDAPVPAPRP